MFRWSVLVVALLATAPALWDALGTQTVDLTSALIHYVVAVPIVAALMALVRYATKPRPQPVRAHKRES